MINFLKKIFNRKKQPIVETEKIIEDKSTEKTNEDTLVDIIVSLNANYEIDIKLYIDDNFKYKNLTEMEYALALAEFLHIIMYGKIKPQILDIIINQIRKDANIDFIDKILDFLILMDKNHLQNIKHYHASRNHPMIKPSQVFSRYKNESI